MNSAQTWLNTMTSACWQGGLAVLVVWLICRTWRTLPAAAQAWLWRLAFLKLLAALLWFAPLRLPLLPPQSSADPSPARSLIEPDAAQRPTAIHQPSTAIALPIARPPDDMSFWATTLLVIWLGGATVGVTRLAVQWRLASILRRTGQNVGHDHPLRAVRTDLCARLHISRPPEIRTSDRIAAPLVVGFARPVVVLPADCSADTMQVLVHVLAHELGHVRRRDLLWNWLDTAAGVLFFFHPLVWLARRESRLAREIACDELAVSVSQSGPAAYARTLVDFAERAGRPQRAATPAMAVCVAESFQSLRKRILAMENAIRWSPRARAAASAAVIALALVCIPPWRVVAQDAAKDAAREKDNQTTPKVGDVVPDGHVRPRLNSSLFRAVLYANSLRLQAPNDAVVVDVPVQSGQTVKKGQPLIRFDSRRAEAALRQAEARFALSRAQLKRAEQLLKTNALAQAEFDEKAAAEQVATAEIELARQDLEETRVSAPFDGVVQVTARPGQRVRRGNDLGEIVDRTSIHARFRIPQATLADVKAKQPVTIRVTALQEQQFTARISYIAPVVDTATGTAEADATLDAPTDALLPGMSAVVDLQPPAPAKNRPR
jgi:beta-lactamase regulating signal transducer with metallopeptidase domain